MIPRHQPIESAWRSAWSPFFRGQIYEYGRKLNLQDGYARRGNFDVNTSRYLIDVFHDLRDPWIRNLVTLKAVQTGGSLTSDIWVPYLIEHDRGGVLWLMQDDKFAKDFSDTRFSPLLYSIPEIARILEDVDRHSKQKTTIILPGMTVSIGGLNEGNCQGLSWRYVIVDEGWRARSNGLIRQAKARTTAFPHTGKFHLISQAGVEGDDLDIEWKETNQKEWSWRCRGCGKLQPYYWTERRDDNSWCGIMWDENERTRPDGKWNMAEVLQTIRLACKFCPAIVTDTPENRRQLDNSSEYVAMNPGALYENAGHHWNALASVDISFASLVYKYLNAKTQFDEFNYILYLQEFYQKCLARPWSLNTDVEIHEIKSEIYDVKSSWPDELTRFMTVDCQKDFTQFWIVVRAWSAKGESRQLARRKAESWEEVARIQKEFKVADQRVFVDIGYEQTKVARECSKHGHQSLIDGRSRWLCWTGLKGSDFDTFTHIVPRIDAKGKPMRDRTPENYGKILTRKEQRTYSTVDYLDPNIGQKSRLRPVPYYTFSNLHISDILKRLRDGQGAKWEALPEDLPLTDNESFTMQMHAEICTRERDKFGKRRRRWVPVSERRPNHFWDDEKMQIAAACTLRIIGGSEPEPPPAPPGPADNEPETKGEK